MLGYIDTIKEKAAALLADGRVDMVIGYRKGTVPMVHVPCVARSQADLAQFVWDSHCGMNLVNYLTGRKEKIAIVAKGCDSRNIVTHIIEGKIKREQLVILGVPCKGMIDRHKVSVLFETEISAVTEVEDRLIVTGGGVEKTFAKTAVLQRNCVVCVHRNPVVSDLMVAEAVEEQTGVDRFAQIDSVEAMSLGERWNYFEDLLSPCIRCYACRNACPLCYCPTCFVDESNPQWVGKADHAIDIRTFHFLRAFHCAGRCTDCGACARACPMGIDVRAFTKKLEKDCLELWDWEAGMSTQTRPALDTYKPEDPDDFIK